MAGAAGAGVLTRTVGDAFTQVSLGAGVDTNVLVVLSLRGGADGLSMVVPYGDPGYAAARPRIKVEANTLLKRNGYFGLHPKFAPLQDMWSAGKFGAVQAVGLEVPDRSHFAAMEKVEDADIGSAERRGWINRMIGDMGTIKPQEAIQLGSSMVPTSLYGSAPVLGLNRMDRLDLPGPTALADRADHRRAYDMLWGTSSSVLGRGARAALTTTDEIGYLSDVRVEPQNGATYPAGDLGKTLSESATIIRQRIGARVITVDAGNWDMHAQLGHADAGSMQARVSELALCLAAFFKDLGTAADKVTLVTISEFGRRVHENGNAGLDHGWGGCMLMLGAGVKGGQVHGQWPKLDNRNLQDGDLRVTTDYRSVLTEVVRSRFPTADSTKVFPGFIPELRGTMA